MKVRSTPKFFSNSIWRNVYELIRLILNVKVNSDLQHEHEWKSMDVKIRWIYHWILEQTKPEIEAIHKAEVCGWFCDVVSIWTWLLSLSTTIVTPNRAPKYPSNFCTRPDSLYYTDRSWSVVGYKISFRVSKLDVYQFYNCIGRITNTVLVSIR